MWPIGFFLFSKAISKKNHAVTEQTKNVDILCKAYQGLVYYVEWILAKSRHKQFQDLGKSTGTCTFPGRGGGAHLPPWKKSLSDVKVSEK